MPVLGVRHPLPAPGCDQLAVRDDVRHADHVPEQREPEPTTGTGERAHNEVRPVQPVRVGRALAVGDRGRRHAGHRPSAADRRRQPQPVQLLVSANYLHATRR